MPQFIGPDQGPSMGRGQRPEVETPTKIHSRIGRLPRPDHHRGQDLVGRDGRVVQFGEEIRQVQCVRGHQVADLCGNQGRGKGKI